jgi:hypothetical protein
MEILSVVRDLFAVDMRHSEGNSNVFIFITFGCGLAKSYEWDFIERHVWLDFCVSSKNNELGKLPLGVWFVVAFAVLIV